MDDHSWMYRDSPQELRKMDYCNGVQGFINFATSIPRNFTDGGIRCPYRKCKNLKFLHQDVVMIHLLTKGFMEDYLCWYVHGELFVTPYSCWPVILTIYNLPPGMCMRPEFMFLSIVIPGPSSPGRNIDVCFRSLIDELTQLWSSGALIYGISRK
jgi:hypothetical protein